MLLQRGPLRVFFSIYQYDEQAAEEKLSAVPTTDTQPTGSVIEVSESVTITELVKSPGADKTAAADKDANPADQSVAMETTTEHKEEKEEGSSSKMETDLAEENKTESCEPSDK